MNKQTTTNKTINTAAAFGATEAEAPNNNFVLATAVKTALQLSGAASAGLYAAFQADLKAQRVTSATFKAYWAAMQSQFNKEAGTIVWRDTAAAKLSSALKGCLLAAEKGFIQWATIPKNKAEHLLSGKAFIDGQSIVYRAKEDLEADRKAAAADKEATEAAEAEAAAAVAKALRATPEALAEALAIVAAQLASGEALASNVLAAAAAVSTALAARKATEAAARKAAAATAAAEAKAKAEAEAAPVFSEVTTPKRVSKRRVAMVAAMHADRAAA